MRRLMALITCTVLLCAVPACRTQAEESSVRENGGIQYVVQEDGTAKIVGYTEDQNSDDSLDRTHELYLPSLLDGYTVTAIGEESFGDYFWAGSIFVPKTIVSIESKALNLSRVESIFVLPGNPVYESVGGVLYDKTKKMLHSYPGGRWSERYSVRKGTLSIGEDAFYGCYGLKKVELPEGLMEIGDRAFLYCESLTEAALPQSLVRIGEEAFCFCEGLMEIVIPANVSDIGAKAFSMCRNMKAISVATENSSYTAVDGVLFTENGKRLHAYPGNRNDAQFSVPESVEYISDEAFIGSVYLQKVVISAGIKSIGHAAFAVCESLKEVEVMEGNGSYHDEDGVLFCTDSNRLEAYPADRMDTAYEIPVGTLAVGEGAFSSCFALVDITVPGSVLLLDEFAFYQCTGLKEISLPSGITKIAKNTFADCFSLTNVTIPYSVKEIGEGAFRSCYSLDEVYLPEGLQSIGKRAFQWCSELMGVFVPDSVTRIEKDAFWGCEQLILEVMQHSAGHTFAQSNEMDYTIHPGWLK